MLTGDEVRAIHDELWLDPDDDAKACVSLIDNHGPFLASLVDAYNASGWSCDENFPSYFRAMMAAYWTNHPSDYTDSAGNPVPPDDAVVKAVAESVLEYWWGRIG